jgi:hypothetical protein
MRPLIEIESIPIKIETKTTYGRFQPLTDDPFKNQSAYKDSLNQTVKAASVPVQEMKVTDPVIGVQENSGISHQIKSDVYNSGQKEGYTYTLAQTQSYENGVALSNEGDNVVTGDFLKAGIQNVTVSNAAQNISENSNPEAAYLGGETQKTGTVADSVMEAYERDRASFQASLEAGVKSFEYVPGSVEFDVVQNPEVNFTYTGGFIYVPRSADPDYVEDVSA